MISGGRDGQRVREVKSLTQDHRAVGHEHILIFASHYDKVFVFYLIIFFLTTKQNVVLFFSLCNARN